MDENSNKENETQAKPYVIANPVDGGRGPNTTESVSGEVKEEVSNASSDSNNNTPSTPEVRYNPVTGEDMNMDELLKKDEGAVDNSEKLKTIEVNTQNNNPMSSIMLVLFFGFLIAFVIFLPNIQSLIAERRAGNKSEPEITSGTLECELQSHTMNLDTTYERSFDFEDKKVKKAKFITTVRGDSVKDEEVLDSLSEKCHQISLNVDSLSGVSVSCSNENGKVVESATYDYASYNKEDVSAAYAEAGGELPEFGFDEDIEQVEIMMNRSGYTCKRKK